MTSNKDLRRRSQSFLRSLARKAEAPPPEGLPPDALILGTDAVENKPAYLRYEDLSVMLHMIGGPGSGKSNCLRVLADQLLKHKQRTGNGFGIIDPHGTLARYVRNLIASQYPDFAPELVFFD